jgi:hypothetical protein
LRVSALATSIRSGTWDVRSSSGACCGPAIALLHSRAGYRFHAMICASPQSQGAAALGACQTG